MSNPRAIGVLGLGSIGLRHARNLLALGAAVTGFDPDPARRALLEQAGGAATDSRETALGAGEAVVVATPSGQHADDLAAAVASGRHVFVEKPLAHRDTGLDAVLAQAGRNGLVVFAAFMLRYHPVVERLRALLGENAIGTVYAMRAIYGSWLPGWRPQQDYRTGYAADPVTGGVIHDVVHEIDLACHLLGPAAVASCVAGRSGLLELASEDMADLVLRHATGAVTNLHLDYLARPAVREGTLLGQDGTLDYDLNRRTLRWRDAAGSLREDTVYEGSWDDDYLTEMAHFLACLDGGATPRCDGIEALAVLTTTLAARAMAGLPQ